jgi:hypothetical protein
MKGHVARKRGRYYAVIYEGLDPITGKERRSWHPAGADRAEAEALAKRLANERDGRNDDVRQLTFGAYLSHHWLPTKKRTLRISTYRGYVQKTQNHILPVLGKKRLRRLQPEDLERLYDLMLAPTDDRAALAPKTVYAVHLLIRAALKDAQRRGLIHRNPADIATAPRMRSTPAKEPKTWTAEQLQAFLREAVDSILGQTFGDLERLKVAWIGDGNNMANAWIQAASMLGFTLILACPDGYDPDTTLLHRARQNARVELVRDPEQAAAGAHVVTTDVWASMGQEEEQAKRARAFADYVVDEPLMLRADPSAIFLHCLPAHRGEEVSAGVIDGRQSRVWDEAENRLHVQKALMAVLMGGEKLA